MVTVTVTVMEILMKCWMQGKARCDIWPQHVCLLSHYNSGKLKQPTCPTYSHMMRKMILLYLLALSHYCGKLKQKCCYLFTSEERRSCYPAQHGDKQEAIN